MKDPLKYATPPTPPRRTKPPVGRPPTPPPRPAGRKGKLPVNLPPRVLAHFARPAAEAAEAAEPADAAADVGFETDWQRELQRGTAEAAAALSRQRRAAADVAKLGELEREQDRAARVNALHRTERAGRGSVEDEWHRFFQPACSPLVRRLREAVAEAAAKPGASGPRRRGRRLLSIAAAAVTGTSHPALSRLQRSTQAGAVPQRLFVIPPAADSASVDAAKALFLDRWPYVYSDLRRAAVEATDGDEIVVVAGTHRSATVAVSKRVSIWSLHSGHPPPVCISASPPLLRITASGCSVRGLDLRAAPRAPDKHVSEPVVQVSPHVDCLLEALTVTSPGPAPSVRVGAPGHTSAAGRPQPPAAGQPPTRADSGTSISGCTMRGGKGDAVAVHGASVTVGDSLVVDSACGVSVHAAARTTVHDTTLSNCTEVGVAVVGDTRHQPLVWVTGCAARGCGTGVSLHLTQGCVVRGCTVDECLRGPSKRASATTVGISLAGDRGSAVSGNTVNGAAVGVSLRGCGDVTVSGCKITGCQRQGVRVEGGSDVQVAETHVSGTSRAGNAIEVFAGARVRLTGNVVSDNAGGGVSISGRRTDVQLSGGSVVGTVGLGCCVRVGASLRIEETHFRGGRSSSLHVSQRAKLDAAQVSFTGCASDAVVLDGCAIGYSVRGCRFERCQRRGVVVRGSGADTVRVKAAPPSGKIEGCQLSDCGGAAIAAVEAARPAVVSNTVTSCRAEGILVDSGSDAVLKDNKLTGCVGSGIRVVYSGAVVEGNTCADCKGDGVQLEGDPRPGVMTVKDNVCTDNAGAGVCVHATVRTTVIEANDLRGNSDGVLVEGIAATAVVTANIIGFSARAGIAARGYHCRPEVSDNTVAECTQGIAVHDSAEGKFSGNTVQCSKGFGVCVSEGAAPLLEGNTVSMNGGGGIEWKGAAKGRAIQNTVEDNVGCGLLVRTGADPSVSQNKIMRNGDCGVKVVEQGGGAFVENEISGHGVAEILLGLQGDPVCKKNILTKGHNGVLVRQRGGGCFEDNVLDGPFTEDGMQLSDGRERAMCPTLDCSAALPKPTLVKNNVVRQCARHGLYFRPDSLAVVTHNTVSHCSATGITCETGCLIQALCRNSVEHCPGNGIRMVLDAAVDEFSHNSIREVGGTAISVEGFIRRQLHIAQCRVKGASVGIMARSADCRVTDCSLSNVQKDCITAEGCQLQLFSNKVKDCVGSGVRLHQCSGVCERNVVFSCAGSGIHVTECPAALRMIRNEISKNGAAGIRIGGVGSAIAADNELTSNHTAEIDVELGATPTLTDNNLVASEGVGILFRSASGGRAADNMISGSELSQVLVTGNSTPVLVENVIRNGHGHGLEYINNRSGGRAEHNRIFHNEGEAIRVENSDPLLEGNTLADGDEMPPSTGEGSRAAA